MAVAQQAWDCGSEQSSGSGPGVQPSAAPVAGPHQRLGNGQPTGRAAESVPETVEKRAETLFAPGSHTACRPGDETQTKVDVAACAHNCDSGKANRNKTETTFVKVLNKAEPEVESVTKDDTKHVYCVIDTLSESLSDQERKEAADCIRRNADVFSRSEFDLGITDLVEHSIDT